MTKTRTGTATRLDETDVGGISEITILPDGRLYVLGLSEAVWEMLDGAGPWGGLSPERGPRRSTERKNETQENEG
jgi:hypothetical protein